MKRTLSTVGRLALLLGFALALVMTGPGRPGVASAAVMPSAPATDPAPTQGVVSPPVTFASPADWDQSLAAQYSRKAGNWARCTFVGRWEVAADGSKWVKVWGSCNKGWQMDDEWWAVNVRGGDCIGTSTAFNVDNEPKPSVQIGTWDPNLTCAPVTEMCLGRSGGTWGFGGSPEDAVSKAGDSGDQECISWNLGAPPEPTSTGTPPPDGCLYGKPTAKPVLNLTYGPTPGQPSRSSWLASIEVPWATGTASAPFFRAYLVTRPKPSGLSWYVGNTTNTAHTSSIEGPIERVSIAPTTAGSAPSWTTQGAIYEYSNTSDTRVEPKPDVIGVGIVYGNPSGGPTDGVETIPVVSSSTDGNRAMPIGYSDGAGCSWYWGAQIVSSSTDVDQPLGPLPGSEPEPLDTPVYVGDDIPPEGCPVGAVCVDVPEQPAPDDEPDSCGDGFKLSDPTTWAGAALCGVVKAIMALIKTVGKLLDLVAGLVAAFISALGDLLKALFVPSPGAFTSLIGDFRGRVDQSEVGAWSDAFTLPDAGASSGVAARTATAQAAGGCKGPEVDLGSLGLPSEVVSPEPIYPFDACGGAADNAALVRQITGIGLTIGAGFKIFEMVMGSFGAMRQVRIMSAHDWTGPNSGRF